MTFTFLASRMLPAQCATTAFGARSNGTNLGGGITFNLNYDTEADAKAALAKFESVEFPHKDEGAITVLAAELKEVSLKGERWRLKAPADKTRPFGGQSPFTGDVVFKLLDKTTLTCTYEASKLMDRK